jgi:hypothetical protein
MNRYILFIALMACIFLAIFQQSSYGRYGEEIVDQNDVDNDVDSVAITLTHLDVNDTNLELGFKIINNTDHDVWICDSATDWFMDVDNETLVIRMRYNISNAGMLWEIPYPRFWYSRLRPGQEKVKSITHPLPVKPDTLFKASLGNAEHARRLALEIGYYDEDLRALILEIVNVRDKLGCDGSAISFAEVPHSTWEVYNRFFGGVLIAQLFNSPNVEYFRESVMSGGDEIIAPYFRQALYGEQVLRLEVDNVSIPYKSNYPPLTDDPTHNQTEPAGVTMTLTGFDVNDTKLELSYKIKNNTDHDVWICESMSRDYPPPLFEQFLDEDAKTLVIRKRFDLPMREGGEEYPPIGSRYVRLRPGEEKVESVFVVLPVRPYRMSASNKATNAEYAERMALEIGYYDEDLPGLILEIVEISEHLNIDFSVGYHGFRKDVSDRFFGGPIVALLFKGMLGFEPNVRSAEANGEMWMPHFYKVRMGERILRIEVDGVSIPYKSNYPPLND